MKTRSKIMLAACMLLFAAVSVRPQSPLLTNPSSLSQFPTVEQLRAGIKGTDEVDTQAQYLAALYRINTMIFRDLVTAPNGGTYDLPPTADAVHDMYRREITRVSIDQVPPAARDPRYRALEDKYESDPAFLDLLLTQFFSPKFRTDYYAWVRQPVPPAIPRPANGSVQAPTDPSIAKAKAAKVDLGVFGLEIGQPVQLPVCPAFEATKVICVIDPNNNNFAGGLLEIFLGMPKGALTEGFNPNLLDVQLDESHCPDWMSGCNLKAAVENGRLIAITVATRGRSVEKAVNAELKEKYGPPTLVTKGTITPDVGNPFDVNDPIWVLPGLRVEFQVIGHADETQLDVRFGWIRVITESAYEKIVNKPVKRKM